MFSSTLCAIRCYKCKEYHDTCRSMIRVEGMISMICDMQRGSGRWISMWGSWHNWWSAVRQADASPPDSSNRISINEISLFCNIKYQLVCFWLFGICDPFHICSRTCDLFVCCKACKPKWDMFLVFLVFWWQEYINHSGMLLCDMEKGSKWLNQKPFPSL